MTTYAKGHKVIVRGEGDILTVEAGPFQALNFTHGFYVIKRANGTHRWVAGNRLKEAPRKPEGHQVGDWAEIPGQPGARVKLATPYVQPDGSRSWVIRNSAGRFVMASERSLNVVERPSESRRDAKLAGAAAHLKDAVEHSGYALIGSAMYALGPGVTYVDRYGCHWGAELVQGKALARLKVDGRPNTGSPTLQAVLNSYGPLKRKD